MKCLPTCPLELARPLGNFAVFDSSSSRVLSNTNGARITTSGLDRVVGAVGSVIRDAGRASGIVAVHAIDHRERDQAEIAGRVGHGKMRDERAGLRAVVAAEALAEAAIGAGRPALVVARDDGVRRLEGLIAECLRRCFEQTAGLIEIQRRQRELALAGRFERIAALDDLPVQISCLARNTEIVFGEVVIRFELGVGERPIGERGVFGDRLRAVAFDGLRTRAEIVLVKAP